MKRRRHSPEQIMRLLAEGEKRSGLNIEEVARHLASGSASRSAQTRHVREGVRPTLSSLKVSRGRRPSLIEASPRVPSGPRLTSLAPICQGANSSSPKPSQGLISGLRNPMRWQPARGRCVGPSPRH